ncbi:hypothetical protein CYMTET_31446 [Cymbomonas tetramitiformis]|uniref:Uncharacterized protein n=1 Tax=Cymbomonas tetramitiformis TaxID=36881 RepID=A0AAE0KT53_9CHLO|nr:hypothetical protein CYMTET_31446 [Cymbomonas tetramitiformis]
MDQHEDRETMEAFRSFVAKTFCYPLAPGENATDGEKLEYEKECNDMLQKRSSATERQLLDYKLKRGIWAREVIWENAKVMSAAAFWFLYGARSKELQLTGMRACGQVSGAGAAERGHKDMNLIETKSRNRMHWDNVEA